MRYAAAKYLVPFTLLLSQPTQAQMVTISPEQIGQIFCIGSLGNDMAPAEALLSPGLAAVIADAWKKNAAYETANPGEKPPLGDGLPWRSYPDYADGCTVGSVKAVEDGSTTVEIRYSFTEWPDAAYADELIIIPSAEEPGRWEIDNVKLLEGETMRSYLAGSFDLQPRD